MQTAIHNRNGERLDHALHHSGVADAPLVVIGHGLTSAKDRPWSLAIADDLAAHGVDALRFSFAGNGQSQGRFVDATPSKEVGDLGSVLDAFPGRRVAYVGHSMGAAVGVLRAAADPRITALVSLAGMVHAADFLRLHFAHLRVGDLILDKPGCPLSQALVDDAEHIGSVIGHARRIRVPWLIVHPTDDELVPLGDSQDAADACPQAELVQMEDCDHRFTGREAQLAHLVGDWFRTIGFGRRA